MHAGKRRTGDLVFSLLEMSGPPAWPATGSVAAKHWNSYLAHSSGVAPIGCMQKPRRMRHQHGVQRAARATSRARRPRISRSCLAHSGDVLDQHRALARAQGALCRAERRFPMWPRRRWSGPEAPGLLTNAAAKFGVGASSVSRALAKHDDEAPVTS
jgi:hypothetical protein